MMEWFNSRRAAELGEWLAEQYAPRGSVNASPTTVQSGSAKANGALQHILQLADRDVRPLNLNFYKRARFANSFKWRLLANDIDATRADQVTHALLMHLSAYPLGLADVGDAVDAPIDKTVIQSARQILLRGNKNFENGAYDAAVSAYHDFLDVLPHHAEALTNLGAALCKLGRYHEAEETLRQAIDAKDDNPEAHNNLGNVLRWTGRVAESERSLRRALKLRPTFSDARASLGLTLLLLGRVRDARARFEKVLKEAPRNVDALFGMGQAARMDGRFEEATTYFKRVLEIAPSTPGACAALSGLRKMTTSDAPWLEGALKIAAGGIPPVEEADLRFAIGKYLDDVNDFGRAFENYKRGNELLKSVVEDYDRQSRCRFVDNMIHAYSRETVSGILGDASTSKKPVFVVGMMRSGTSLVEHIISSHRSAAAAGELPFWSDAVRENEGALMVGSPAAAETKRLAQKYLKTLSEYSPDALRIVDKAPVNSDYLGLIHSVFPNARFIYMVRDPIDTCLSCYFQQFSASLNFTMDLSDLAHYFREHQRLVSHWRSILPSGTLLDVPYAELVADQQGWTRKILAFLELEWDEACLDFQGTKRSIVTASYWQVRQHIYTGSVDRWRNYQKFIGPLLSLAK